MFLLYNNKIINSLMRKKITQARVAPHLSFFKDDFLKKWGLTDYTSTKEPCVFFGCTSNFDAIQKHEGFKVIWSAGPGDNIDWKLLNNKSNTAILTGQNKFKIPPEIIFKQELIPVKDYSRFKPNVLGDKVYYYSGLDNLGGGDHNKFIKDIQDRCGYEIITTHCKAIGDYKGIGWLKENYYDKCFINLNTSVSHFPLRYPDSGMSTNKELGLMGRLSVMNPVHYNEVYKGMIPYKAYSREAAIENIVEIIKMEAKKIGTVQPAIDSHTITTDEWLYLDFYQKR